jgi:YegS/Rv2252/BmrU family lipid kinase
MGRGARLVVAWGGDGTVNEVGTALAFGEARLGIVPAGSGNGLARDLGLPLTPEAALEAAMSGCVRVIDAGELDGRLFFNVAGVGVDACVAHRFAEAGGRRGLAGYASAAWRELRAYVALEHLVTTDGVPERVRPLLVAIANSRQYGNGALIAPRARLDDGRLDVVVVETMPVWRLVARLPRLFDGRLGDVPGVRMRTAEEVEVCVAGPVRYHVDGEPGTATERLRGRVRGAAIAVQVPAGASVGSG